MEHLEPSSNLLRTSMLLIVAGWANPPQADGLALLLYRSLLNVGRGMVLPWAGPPPRWATQRIFPSVAPRFGHRGLRAVLKIYFIAAAANSL